MRIAIPTFGSRVAPSFLHSNSMLIAVVVSGEVAGVDRIETGGLTEDERLKLLEERHVSVLVCGGMDQDVMTEIQERGIKVVHNVAGETDVVLTRVAEGTLRSGYGITYRSDSPAAQPECTQGEAESSPEQSASVLVDCAACEERVCLQGTECPHWTEATQLEALGPRVREILETAFDIACEPERALCRIAELIYYCLGLKVRHLGLAFCVDLFSEAQTVERLLRRFFRVSSVCCRLGRMRTQDDHPMDHRAAKPCNPFAMADLLNRAGTDVNIVMGLCTGTDIVFSQLSEAPSTTLFVKDRLLANNPIGAVHSRYVLKHILDKT